MGIFYLLEGDTFAKKSLYIHEIAVTDGTARFRYDLEIMASNFSRFETAQRHCARTTLVIFKRHR